MLVAIKAHNSWFRLSAIHRSNPMKFTMKSNAWNSIINSTCNRLNYVIVCFEPFSVTRIVSSRIERSTSRSRVQRWSQPSIVINSGHDEEVVASTGKRAEKMIESYDVNQLDVHVPFALLHAGENIARGHGLQSCLACSNGGQIPIFPIGLRLHARIRKLEIDRRQKRTIEVQRRFD